MSLGTSVAVGNIVLVVCRLAELSNVGEVVSENCLMSDAGFSVQLVAIKINKKRVVKANELSLIFFIEDLLPIIL